MTSMSLDHRPAHGGYPTITVLEARLDNLKHKLARHLFGQGMSLTNANLAVRHVVSQCVYTSPEEFLETLLAKPREQALLSGFTFSMTDQGHDWWWRRYVAMGVTNAGA